MLSSSRDNWDRLVVAVVKRQQVWELCHQQSFSTIAASDDDDDDDDDLSERSLSCNFSVTPSPPHPQTNPSTSPVGDLVKQTLATSIQLTDQVIKAADDAATFKQECTDLKSKTEKLAALLRQVARASNDQYERPTRCIVDNTVKVLVKALALVLKCRSNGIMKRVLTIIPAAAFRKMFIQLEDSIGDMSWLNKLHRRHVVSSSTDELGLPPIAIYEPILGLIWEQITILYIGSLDDRADAAASLVLVARQSDRYTKLIIEEGGVAPLLKLVKEGNLEGLKKAAEATGLL